MSTEPDGFSSCSCILSPVDAAGRRPRCRRGWPDRSPVHIFSTPTASTVPEPPKVAMVARWRAEAPPAHELSTLTMPALRSPDRRRKVWPRMQPWSINLPGGGVPEHHQVDVGGVDPGVGQGVGHHLVRPSPRRCGPAGSWRSSPRRRWIRCGPRCPRYPRAGTPTVARAAIRRSNCSNGWSAVT